MSYTQDPSATSIHAAGASPSSRGREFLREAAAGLVGAAVIIVAGNMNVDRAAGEDGGLREALVTGALCLVVASVLFGVLLPRLQHRSGTTLVLAVLSVLSLLVFWSGLPAILGTAAAAVGRGPSQRLRPAAWVGVAAAALAVVWSVVGLFL
jgi:hypothetical protein